MENNNIELPGFKITVSSVAGKNADRGAIPILSGQLGAKITEFLDSKLALHGALTVRLSIEN